MAVELVEEFSEELVEAFSRLIPQLSQSAKPVSYTHLTLPTTF